MSGHLVTEPHLPPPMAPGTSNGERDYYRRRIDQLVDVRLKGIEDAVRSLDDRADTIDKRLNLIFGGLTVVSILGNLFGPAIVKWLTGQP